MQKKKSEGIKCVQIEQINYEDLLQSIETIVEEKVKEALATSPTTTAPTEFLTRADVAKLFGVTLPTVHAWANKGVITLYKIGGKTRFKRSEVLEVPPSI